MNQDELYHYGVKGMKWGVRRTPAQLGHDTRSERSKQKSADKAERKRRKTDLKNRRTMSDADIKKRIERLKLEAEYKKLTEADIAPGRRFVKDIMSSSSKSYLTNAAKGTMAYAVKAAMTGRVDPMEAASYVASNPNKKKN